MPTVATVTKQKPTKKRAKVAHAEKKANGGKARRASGASASKGAEPHLAGKYADVLVSLEQARRTAKLVGAPIDDAIEELMQKVEDTAGYRASNLARGRELTGMDVLDPANWRAPYPVLVEESSGQRIIVRSARQRARDIKEAAARAEKLHRLAIDQGMELLDGDALVGVLNRRSLDTD